ncbi:hypothetical protein HanRHA438_Chr03g0137661 [Helianthus annuus]|nr:hypothetical protein HanRHA438_Chr03g0137661 [Helianthus annuus]
MSAAARQELNAEVFRAEDRGLDVGFFGWGDNECWFRCRCGVEAAVSDVRPEDGGVGGGVEVRAVDNGGNFRVGFR